MRQVQDAWFICNCLCDFYLTRIAEQDAVTALKVSYDNILQSMEATKRHRQQIRDVQNSNIRADVLEYKADLCSLGSLIVVRVNSKGGVQLVHLWNIGQKADQLRDVSRCNDDGYLANAAEEKASADLPVAVFVSRKNLKAADGPSRCPALLETVVGEFVAAAERLRSCLK